MSFVCLPYLIEVFLCAEAVVEKLVPPKKAALKELNMKALSLGKNYNK